MKPAAEFERLHSEISNEIVTILCRFVFQHCKGCGGGDFVEGRPCDDLLFHPDCEQLC